MPEDRRQPGDWAVCPIAGPGGAAITFAEWAAGDGFTRWDHALLYIGYGQCLEAEPDGARITTRPILDGDWWSTGLIDYPPAVRAQVPSAAFAAEGTPYSWLDYLALAGHRLHLPDWPLWPGRATLRAYISDTGHAMCSQLVDQVLTGCGARLFDDGRWPGYVMPADLGRLLTAAAAR